MSEASLRLSGFTIEGLAALDARLADLYPAMEQAAGIIRSSVLMNFGEQGRPERWRPLRPETVERKGSSLMLIDTGRLAGSISVKAGRDCPGIRARALREGPAGRQPWGRPAREALPSYPGRR